VKNERPTAIQDCNQHTLLPSAVHYGDRGEVVVGQDALLRAAEHPRETIVSVKRFMGRGADDPETRRLGPYEFTAPKNGDANVVRFAVRNRVVTLDEMMTPDDLGSLRNYVNRNFAGWKLSDARRELLSRMDEQRAEYDAVLTQLTVLYQKGLLEVDHQPWIHMEGASNLVGLDLHLTRERMRDLFRALEEKKRVVELLDRFLEPSNGQIGVHVGLEDAHPAMKELALIGVSLPLPGGLIARIAVLGPVRMQYERVVASVLHLGQAFERAQT